MRGNWIDKQDPAHKHLPGQSLDLSQRHLGTMELNYANDTLRCAFQKSHCSSAEEGSIDGQARRETDQVKQRRSEEEAWQGRRKGVADLWTG